MRFRPSTVGAAVIWALGNPLAAWPVKDSRQLPRFCLPNASKAPLPTQRAGRMRALTVLLIDLGRLSSRTGPRSLSVSSKSSETRRGSLKSSRAWWNTDIRHQNVSRCCPSRREPDKSISQLRHVFSSASCSCCSMALRFAVKKSLSLGQTRQSH